MKKNKKTVTTLAENEAVIAETTQTETPAVVAPYAIGDIIEVIEPRPGVYLVSEELPLRKGDEFHFRAFKYKADGTLGDWRIHLNQEITWKPGTIPVAPEPKVKAPKEPTARQKAKAAKEAAEAIPEVDLTEVAEELA